MTTQTITPITTTVAGAQAALGIGKTEVYKLLNEGAIKSFFHGKRRLIMYSSLEQWAQSQLSQSQTSQKAR